MPFTTFKEYLTRFVNETRALGAYPILVATQPRNAWNAGPNPTVYPAYHDYPVASRQLAGELGVPLIDLDARGIALLQSAGPVLRHQLSCTTTTCPANGRTTRTATPTPCTSRKWRARTGQTGGRGHPQPEPRSPTSAKLIPALKPTYRVSFSSNNAAGGQITPVRSTSRPAPPSPRTPGPMPAFRSSAGMAT